MNSGSNTDEHMVELEARLAERTAELCSINRRLRMTEAFNRVLIHATEEKSLLNAICAIAVEQGGYRMSWVGYAENDVRKSVRPAAQAGFEDGYLETANITWDDTECGHGPTGTAIRTEKHVIARQIRNEPKFEPWRKAALDRGYTSSIAIPLQDRGKVFGALMLYASEPDAFGDQEVELLLDLAANLAYGVAVLRMNAERNRIERSLHESDKKYRELVEHANSIILRWTQDGRITFINTFGQRFFGYSSEEIVGRRVLETIVPPTDIGGRDLRKLMTMIFSDVASFEQNVNENIRRNGERVWIAWTNRIVKGANGVVDEIQSVGIDITELKRAEEAIRDLNTTLERRVADRTAELAVAKDRAEAADRLKSAFLATMSHEFRTPLNSIIGFTGILLQGLAGTLNAEQRKQLSIVRDSSRHLLALINDVLDISKIEAGQLEIFKRPFDFLLSIEKTVAMAKPLAAKKGLTLQVDLPPNIGVLKSDAQRVEQILLNLLNNAIKFTREGMVTLSATITEGKLHVSVSDTGIGIKPEDVPTLFRPFRQIDSSLTRQHEGSGLGLAICKRLAGLLGGEMTVTSTWNVGSVFTLILPAEPS